MTDAYHVLAVDLDGTLLTSDKCVTRRTAAHLEAASRSGLRIVFVTGRNLPMARSVARPLRVPVTIIAHNGAIVADGGTGRILDAEYLPDDAAKRLCERFREWECRPFVYVSRDGAYLLRHDDGPHNPALERYLASNRTVCAAVGDLAEVFEPQRSAQRVIHIVAIEPQERVVAALEGMPSEPEAVLMTSGGLYNGDYWFLEAIHERASKRQAVSDLCDRWGCSLREVVAIGDNLNDVELLESAGLGVAMANAPGQVKAAADHVTRSNDEDGVAHALVELLGIDPGSR